VSEQYLNTNVLRSLCGAPKFLTDFNQIWRFSTDFLKVLNIKFQEIPSSGCRAGTYGQTDRWTDMTNLVVYVLITSFLKVQDQIF